MPRSQPRGLLLGLLLVAWPSHAQAINGTRPRVPPSFFDHACMTVVGPETPLVEIGLTVPYTDIELTDDELPDSRTLQLFAFGRDRAPGAVLPNWVSADDVQRALEAGILETAPPSADVLATSGWDDVTVPLVSIDERLPIACDSAGPWPWDTQGAPLGAYVVFGYTFEPPRNLWTPRPGVIRVVDADGSGPPAVALSGLDRRLEFGREQGLAVQGCLSGDPGTEVELSWARASEPDVWTPFERLTPEDGTFEAALWPPEDTVYEALHVRAEAIDPAGRRFAYHARDVVVVLEACVEESTAAAVVDDGCGVAPAQDGGDRAPLPCQPDPAEDEDEDTEDAAPPATDAQGCAVGPRGGSGWFVWMLLLVGPIRRHQSPREPRGPACCGLGTELDWARTFWDFRTDSGEKPANLAPTEVVAAAFPYPSVGADNCSPGHYSAILAALGTQLGWTLLFKFSDKASYNGADY